MNSNWQDSPLINRARDYAIHCHNSTNHKYDNFNYSYHLAMVVDVATLFSNLIPENLISIVIAACWCHDTIEDTRQSYNDVVEATNYDVAEIVYAVTTEKGRNRKERASSKYYEGIKQNFLAVFVKLCDRIANVRHAKETKSKMFDKYKNEYKEFCSHLYTKDQYEDMWAHLNTLLFKD